jgi:FAD/FMN-containing dehydrogenase
VPIVPQGGNSGMVGGATPDASGTAALLSLRRLNELSIDEHDRRASAGAGVVLQHLHERCGELGLRFPLDLGGKGAATIGGLVSTNAGGSQVLRHGVMRHLVAGLEVVTAGGQIYDALSPLKKDNRGFDLKQLFIGSEGTLGIVTRVAVRLVPAITQRRTVWAGLDALGRAEALLNLCEQGLPSALEALEVLPQECLDTVLSYLPGARPPFETRYPWHALLEFVSSEVTDHRFENRVDELLAAAISKGVLQDAVIASSETQAESFWALRENISAAEKAAGLAVQHDVSVPVGRMSKALETIERAVVEAFPRHEVRGFGHIGDGNIHLHVRAPTGAGASWSTTTAPKVSGLVYELVSAMGGSISAEHGIGQDKIGTLERLHDPVALDLMRRVKQALDPHGLLNPGKLVRVAPEGPAA